MRIKLKGFNPNWWKIGGIIFLIGGTVLFVRFMTSIFNAIFN